MVKVDASQQRLRGVIEVIFELMVKILVAMQKSQ